MIAAAFWLYIKLELTLLLIAIHWSETHVETPGLPVARVVS